MTPKIKITRVDSHRNGVAGEPFNVVQFTEDKEKFFAVVFSRDEAPFNPRVAVFKQSLAGEGNFKFGENSWRGDHYADELYAAIDAHNG